MHEEHHHAAPASVWDRRRIGARSLRRSSAAGSKPCKYRRRGPETVARPHKRQSPYQLPQSHAHASPENMACPSQPPCRFDTKVESQIQPREKPADSVNPENALIARLKASGHSTLDAERALRTYVSALKHLRITSAELEMKAKPKNAKKSL